MRVLHGGCIRPSAMQAIPVTTRAPQTPFYDNRAKKCDTRNTTANASPPRTFVFVPAASPHRLSYAGHSESRLAGRPVGRPSRLLRLALKTPRQSCSGMGMPAAHLKAGSNLCDAIDGVFDTTKHNTTPHHARHDGWLHESGAEGSKRERRLSSCTKQFIRSTCPRPNECHEAQR